MVVNASGTSRPVFLNKLRGVSPFNEGILRNYMQLNKDASAPLAVHAFMSHLTFSYISIKITNRRWWPNEVLLYKGKQRLASPFRAKTKRRLLTRKEKTNCLGSLKNSAKRVSTKKMADKVS
ncbi:hypothetical protein MIDIC_510037 [Alphaproteobacteria bacterium]